MDDIKMDLKEMEWDDMDWIYLGEDRDQWRTLVNTVMNHHVECLSSYARRGQLHEVSH
jgi:hypothetical protein